MPNPHLAAARSAQRTVDELATLFARMGTADHPRGAVLAAYRAARRALADNFSRPGAVSDALMTLRMAVQQSLTQTMSAAADLGYAQAARELGVYGLNAAGGAANTTAGMQSVLNTLDAQINAVRAMSLSGADPALVLGDAGRVGLLTPSPIIREGARWLALTAVLTHKQVVEESVKRSGGQDEFRRQAIAALDERTTETCLRVHGQVVTIDGDFHLTGTPRYADDMHAPPFHDYCRTAVALVRIDHKDDELSGQMRDAARAELRAREETGTREEVHPAHARSRRG